MTLHAYKKCKNNVTKQQHKSFAMGHNVNTSSMVRRANQLATVTPLLAPCLGLGTGLGGGFVDGDGFFSCFARRSAEMVDTDLISLVHPLPFKQYNFSLFEAHNASHHQREMLVTHTGEGS